MGPEEGGKSDQGIKNIFDECGKNAGLHSVEKGVHRSGGGGEVLL